MYKLNLVYDGNYESYFRWTITGELISIFDKYGIICILSSNNDCDGVMNNFTNENMCSGKINFDINELKKDISTHIKAFLQENSNLEEFVLKNIYFLSEINGGN